MKAKKTACFLMTWQSNLVGKKPSHLIFFSPLPGGSSCSSSVGDWPKYFSGGNPRQVVWITKQTRKKRGKVISISLRVSHGVSHCCYYWGLALLDQAEQRGQSKEILRSLHQALHMTDRAAKRRVCFCMNRRCYSYLFNSFFAISRKNVEDLSDSV